MIRYEWQGKSDRKENGEILIWVAGEIIKLRKKEKRWRTPWWRPEGPRTQLGKWVWGHMGGRTGGAGSSFLLLEPQ